jgi:hypothetical protein
LKGSKLALFRIYPEDIWITDEEHKHGRREKREVRIVTDIDWLAGEKKLAGTAHDNPIS